LKLDNKSKGAKLSKISAGPLMLDESQQDFLITENTAMRQELDKLREIDSTRRKDLLNLQNDLDIYKKKVEEAEQSQKKANSRI